MAQAPAERGKKQRVQVKVVDVATGEEQFSSDIVSVGGYNPFCCCCTNWIFNPTQRAETHVQE